VKSERQALSFINHVGYCLASKSDGLELPNLWDAVTSRHNGSIAENGNGRAQRSYYLSYAWDIRQILPNHNSVYYGKIFKRRPSIVSREFFPYFFALTERTGVRDEYKVEHSQGKLSPLAKSVMDILMKNPPMTAKELRMALSAKGTKSVQGLENAIEELQRKMFVSRVVGSEQSFGAQWAPVVKCFPAEVRKAKTITHDLARYKLLEKYFQNQLISSISSIHKVFGWSRQTIYHTIGQLVHAGAITTATVTRDGKTDTCYCFIR
jgi:predicted transcriptional regulator